MQIAFLRKLQVLASLVSGAGQPVMSEYQNTSLQSLRSRDDVNVVVKGWRFHESGLKRVNQGFCEKVKINSACMHVRELCVMNITYIGYVCIEMDLNPV